MQTPENAYRKLDHIVMNGTEVQEGFENLKGPLQEVGALGAIMDFILNANINLVIEDGPLNPFQLQHDLSEQEILLDEAIANLKTLMRQSYVEAIEDHLNASREEN
jgi:predicted metallo-beta-lactamase superfamily hydrolase